MSTPLNNSTLSMMLANKEAEACRDIAEEFFKQRNVDAAIRAIERARSKNTNLPGLASQYAAYMVHKNAIVAKSWYSVLGVKDRCAGVEEIKKHYEGLSRLLQPDRCSSVAVESANKLVNGAWEVLSDARRREVYDMLMGYNQDKKVLLQGSRNPNDPSSSSSKSSPLCCDHCIGNRGKIIVLSNKQRMILKD